MLLRKVAVDEGCDVGDGDRGARCEIAVDEGDNVAEVDGADGEAGKVFVEVAGKADVLDDAGASVGSETQDGGSLGDAVLGAGVVAVESGGGHVPDEDEVDVAFACGIGLDKGFDLSGSDTGATVDAVEPPEV